jgi:hypothetical protein
VSVATQRLGLDEFPLLFAQAPWLTLATVVAAWSVRPGAGSLLGALEAVGRRRGAVFVVMAATLAALLLIARFALDRFPNSGDEYAYILQAQTYAGGRLWAPAPPLPEYFRLERYFAKDGIWISPYQPGWALVLAPFAAVGFPLWAVAPLLGALTVPIYFRLAERLVGRRAAWIALLALVCAPFFLLNFASYFSHGPAALAGVGFALFGVRYLQTGRWSDALIAGACVGYLGFIRAFNAVFFVLPYGLTLLMTPGRRVGLVWFGLGGAPVLAALLAYYALVTGSPLRPVQDWYQQGGEPLGAPGGATILETVRRMVRLYFWTSPLFVLAWVPAFLALALRRRLAFVDWILPLTVAGFVFYGGSGGNQYGPRYFFEAWPMALLTVVRAAAPLLREQPPSRWRAWAASAVLVHLAFQLGYLGPRLAREHDVIAERRGLEQAVQRAQLSNAVVIVAGAVGRTRPLQPIDLARNGLDPLRRPVVFVLDRGERNRELRALFPDRRFYVYRDGALSAAGS